MLHDLCFKVSERMLKKWDILSSEIIFQNQWWKILHERVRLPDGSEYDFYPNEGSDGAIIIPVTSDGQVMLHRQYKHGACEIVVEFPMGRIESGEEPEAAARREFREETGYEAGSVEFLRTLEIFPTGSRNRFHVFLFRDVVKVGEPDSDPRETGEVFFVPKDDLVQCLLKERTTLNTLGAAVMALGKL